MKSCYTRKSLLLLLSVAVASICAVPASQAQFWGYSPYNGTSSWLNASRGFTSFFPFNMYSSRAGAPLYLASNLFSTAGYAANQRMFSRQRQAQSDSQYGGYTSAGLVNNQGQSARQQPIMGNAVGDQMAHARQYGVQPQQPPAEQGTGFDDIPVPANFSQDWSGPAPSLAAQAPVAYPPAQPFSPYPPASTEGGQMPPAAPERAYPMGAPANSNSMFASSGSVSPTYRPTVRESSSSEPLAEGFVQVFNERFGGDIRKALSDKDACKYAKAVGLVDSSKFDVAKISPEKADLIRAIFADPTESASVRLNAVRVLLKH